MRVLRILLGIYFGFWSVTLLAVGAEFVLYLVRGQNWGGPTGRHPILALFSLALGLVFGMGGWYALAGKTSGEKIGRVWAIIASVTDILISLGVPVLHYYGGRAPAFWRQVHFFAPTAAIGIVGLLVFTFQGNRSSYPRHKLKYERLIGDGTIGLINSTKGLLFGSLFLFALVSLKSRIGDEFPKSLTGIWGSVMLVGVASIAIHELSHLTAAVILGMKIRGFFIGPWGIRETDGKWRFQFRPNGFILRGGAVDSVPAAKDFKLWHHVWELLAGPLASASFGLLALWMAFSLSGSVRTMVGPTLSLFALLNIVLAAFNMIPFRIHDGYSDGAQIYQILAGGPWRDYHRTTAMFDASFVTELRPRDYDIPTIERAANGITKGRPGLLLRKALYDALFDGGKISEAGKVLKESESLYRQFALEIPSEVQSAFVFGSAYVLRDAATAREWWNYLRASRPDESREHYWRSAAALEWIEGNLEQANESWNKANALAMKLPNVGVYQYERHCCTLLRRVLDESGISKPRSNTANGDMILRSGGSGLRDDA